MTLLASWVAVDSRGIQSMYMASDSCISWENNKKCNFLHYQKLYACKKKAEMFGFCGEVHFTSSILRQVVDLIDNGLMFKLGYSAQQKAQTILSFIQENYDKYPDYTKQSNLSINIIYCFRAKGGKKARFYCYIIRYDNNKDWRMEELSLRNTPNSPNVSYFIENSKMGTGKNDLEEEINKYIYQQKNGFSRGMFTAFCSTLSKNEAKGIENRDNTYGGPPQLVGIYRKPNSSAIDFGVIYEGKRYFLGQEIKNFNIQDINKINWRNHLFEIYDPITMNRKKGAQAQPKNA